MLKKSLHTRRCISALLLAFAAFAHAAPDAPAAPDPLRGLRVDRGLLSSIDTAGIVQSVRDTTSELVMSAMNFLGVPYRRGGSSLDAGFDCSGFTRHIFEHTVGLVLPRRADEQASSTALVKIGREELRPGDLVFFNTMRRTFSHVGIYIGDDKFVHAPKPGAEVRVDDMRESYWARRFTGARRADLGSLRVAAPTALQ